MIWLTRFALEGEDAGNEGDTGLLRAKFFKASSMHWRLPV